MAQNSPAGTSELIPFGAKSDLRRNCKLRRNCPAGILELLPFGANLELPWGWKSPEIPSQGLFFAFAGASELIPFGANSDLRWNCPTGTSEPDSVWNQLGSLLGFAITGDSFSGISPCFPPLGFTLLIFLWNYIFPSSGFTILLISWGTTYTLHLYIKGHTSNDCDHVFNSLKMLYWKQHFFNFEKCCKILNTNNNVEVIQIFHENFFDLESFLNHIHDIPDPKTTNVNHVFQVKKICHALVIVKSSMVRQSLSIIIRSTIPAWVHTERKELEIFSNT